MSIVLNWKQQPGQVLDSIEIYRYANARATPNPNALGTPLATLPGDATTYEDTAVISNQVYQYRVVSVKGTDKVMGLPIVQGYFPYTGPGPQELLRGDWWIGYFGTLTNQEFFLNSADMNGRAGFGVWNQNPVLFHKFAYKGKIIFIPNSPTMMGTSYNNQYLAGLIWGMSGAGRFTPNGLSAVDQRKTVIKDGFEYIIRLPELYDSGSYSSNYNSLAFFVQGEWYNTMVRLYRGAPATMPGRWGDLDVVPGNAGTDQGVALFAQAYNNQVSIYYRGSYPDSVSTINNANSATVYHVLELILN
ncbi:putative virion structural protein [Erwinia phage vB_EamM_Phobos]|uniref:putative virion structural protein n=1 Tax=Erwinia phage vB_EamM_Phobos TaxID=1883377 RepID=UPI00081C54C3|nr:putative virion structural protein [Erwinia phage vB_EamM_Phobos]ANZ50341.1 putative virion structural protein [Erwinia phage vB_EamM_Phobos]